MFFGGRPIKEAPGNWKIEGRIQLPVILSQKLVVISQNSAKIFNIIQFNKFNMGGGKN